MKRLKKQWPYLEDVPFDSFVNAQPLILIGVDNQLLSLGRKIRQGHWNDPVATKTWLGWVISGNVPKSLRVDNVYAFHVCEVGNEDDLVKLIKTSFSTESFGVRIVEEQCRSKEDQRAMI
ncbi:unnamed protein product [Allacma fusca]|uniref:Peptidase aspartic putative domain-containing protein n=1 Tax=Allacma fusca TaxID=39272 RepID=A0A8J2PR60_9HEXA|nr:unnamed protein product [Allacma fusca]